MDGVRPGERRCVPARGPASFARVRGTASSSRGTRHSHRSSSSSTRSGHGIVAVRNHTSSSSRCARHRNERRGGGNGRTRARAPRHQVRPSCHAAPSSRSAGPFGFGRHAHAADRPPLVVVCTGRALVCGLRRVLAEHERVDTFRADNGGARHIGVSGSLPTRSRPSERASPQSPPTSCRRRTARSGRPRDGPDHGHGYPAQGRQARNRIVHEGASIGAIRSVDRDRILRHAVKQRTAVTDFPLGDNSTSQWRHGPEEPPDPPPTDWINAYPDVEAACERLQQVLRRRDGDRHPARRGRRCSSRTARRVRRPRGAGRMSSRRTRPSTRLSAARSRSPCSTTSTAGWSSSAVVKVPPRRVGIVVLRSISLVISPPSVSTPGESGVTSSSRTPLT